MTENLPPLRTLLAGLVDYAGLFPPAALSMTEAVRKYAEYRGGEYAWMLGRFVVPVSQLAEFEAAAAEFLPRFEHASPWYLSALAGNELDAAIQQIQDFNRRHADVAETGAAMIDAVEFSVSSPEEITSASQRIPHGLQIFVEIPISSDPALFIRAIADAGFAAKVRTGGVTPEAFPSSGNLARFIHACTQAGVPFKATAGLHHPIRAVYNLTYEKGGPSGKMFGFLNVFLAAAFARAGMSYDETVTLLEEESSDAIRFEAKEVLWKTHRLTSDELLKARTEFASSFGSCSFSEPVEDLRGLQLL